GPLPCPAGAGITRGGTVDYAPSRPGFDYDTRRGFYGAMLTANAGTQHPYLYGLAQRDYNDADHDTLITGPIATDFDYNSYYIGIGSSGPIGDRLVYGVEGVYEFGDTLSNSFMTGGPFLAPVPQ